jgi:tripartite ATP-independent transporter DctP family solute receptor
MEMKKHWSKAFVFLIALALILTGCGGSSGSSQNSGGDSGGGKTITLKAGVQSNESEPMGQALQKFADLVNEKSGGSLKVDTYFNATLGDELQLTQSLQSGVVDFAIVTNGAITPVVKEMGLLDLPFMYTDEDQVFEVLDGPFGQKLFQAMEARNIIGLEFFSFGFRHITTSKKPIEKLEDLNGLKLRTQQTPVALETFGLLGVNPIAMPFTELYAALESGAVDGQDNTLSVIRFQKLFEVQPYVSLTKHVYTPASFMMSKNTWDKLTAEQQQVIREAAAEAKKLNHEISVAQNDENMKFLEDNGIKINEISQSEMDRFVERVKSVSEKFASEFGADLTKEYLEAVAAAKK